MDKKKIISSTIVFFITTSIVLLFSGIFGGENVLVGVQGTAAVLFLLTIDFSLNPVKNTIYFVLLELTIGLAAYIASLNPYLAIISTFLMMFYIFYTFTYNTKKPAFLPFSLAFIYMLYDPVTAQQLPKRFLGLIVCGLAIMLLQILANKDRLKKESVSKLNNALESINKQIELVNTNSTERLSLNKDAEVNLNQLIESFTFAINQNKSKVSIDLLKYLSIAQFLDSLNIELNKTNKFTNTEDLSALLNSIKLYVNNESNIDSILDNISVYESKNLENYNNNLNLVVYPYVAKLKRDLQQTNADKIINEYSRSKFFENFNLKNDLSFKSAKFTFAFRGALLLSIGVFLVALFNIENGKWIIFTLAAINQPYLDKANIKLRDRMIGTLVGAAIFFVVYSIVKDDSVRMALLLPVGYAMTYITKYTYSVICITLFALGSISVGANIPFIAIQRLIFVLIGCVIAIIADRLIFPTYAYKYTQSAINKSIATNKEIVDLLSKKDISVETFAKNVQPLIIRNTWLNKYIAYNNTTLNSKDVDEFIYNQNIFINDVIAFESLLYTHDKNSIDKASLEKDFNYIINNNLSNDDVVRLMDAKDCHFNKLILTNFINIKNNLSHSNNLSNNAIKSI